MMLRLASRAAMRAAAVSSGLATRGAARTCSKKAPMLGLMSGFHTSSFRKALSPVGDSDFETGGVGVDMSKEPSMDQAKSMVRSYSEMSNESLLILASIGDHDAHAERLRREVMAVDECSYAEACIKLSEIDDANNQYMGALTLPYKVGIGTFMVTGVGSIPMVFSLDLATWFNAEYVTADVPEPKDLETWLEVGAWTWNWMEPVLGTLSFVLLAFQFTRSQMLNLGKAPYSEFLIESRANRLATRYPQYNAMVIKQFASSSKLGSSSSAKGW